MSDQEPIRYVDLGVMELPDDWDEYTPKDVLRLMRDRLRRQGLRTQAAGDLLADMNATLDEWREEREEDYREEIRQLRRRLAELEPEPASAALGTTSKAEKRGGPIGTPEAEKRKIVGDWLAQKGNVRQKDFARGKGISDRTLRRWVKELS
jgi:DNA-binding transcriptional MerR regulator